MIAERIHALQAEVAMTLLRLQRDPDSVKICAVTKKQPRAAVLAACSAGLHDIGENYVQEAAEKLTGVSGVTKHFIGHIQTNKAKALVAGFDVIQSVDRLDAGVALAKAAQQLGRNIRILVQVNVSPTERFGCAPADAPRLAAELRNLGLFVDGVMAIGPISEDRNMIRRSFEEAAILFAHIGGSTLSIGMSADWPEALASGSTMIRIGTAIFGPRHLAAGTK